jgi:hypothetical protein
MTQFSSQWILSLNRLSHFWGQVQTLAIPPDRVSWECAFTGLTEHGFGMHVKEAGSLLRTDGRLPDLVRRLGRGDPTWLG